MKPQKLLLSSLSMGFVTLISRFLGLLREMVKAYLLGTTAISDAFTLAFTIPNLFRRLTAEGAMLSALLPSLARTKQHTHPSAAKAQACRFFWWFSLVLTVFTVLFMLSASFWVRYMFAAGFTGETLDLTVVLTRIMFVYILFISLAAIFQGMLNHQQVFWVSAFTPILLNLSIIFCAIGFRNSFQNPSYGFAVGVTVGGFLQLVFQYPFVKKQGYKLFSVPKQPHVVPHVVPSVAPIFKNILPGLLGAGVYQANLLFSNLIATTLNSGSLTALNFSNRLLELALGVFVVSFTTTLLPSIAADAARKDLVAVQQKLGLGLRMISFLSLPIVAFLAALHTEVISLLFQRGAFDQQSVRLTAEALVFQLPALLFIGGNRLLVTVNHAFQQYKTTVRLAFLAMLANLSIAVFTAQSLGVRGLSLAIVVSQVLQFGLLMATLPRLLNSQKGSGEQNLLIKNTGLKPLWHACMPSVVRQILAATLMYAVLMGFKTFNPLGLWLSMLVYMMVGATVYLGLSYWLRVKEVLEIWQVMVKRGAVSGHAKDNEKTNR